MNKFQGFLKNVSSCVTFIDSNIFDVFRAHCLYPSIVLRVHWPGALWTVCSMRTYLNCMTRHDKHSDPSTVEAVSGIKARDSHTDSVSCVMSTSSTEELCSVRRTTTAPKRAGHTCMSRPSIKLMTMKRFVLA